jgi:hypothetical protein
MQIKAPFSMGKYSPKMLFCGKILRNVRIVVVYPKKRREKLPYNGHVHGTIFSDRGATSSDRQNRTPCRTASRAAEHFCLAWTGIVNRVNRSLNEANDA